jgi:hypothetical protein
MERLPTFSIDGTARLALLIVEGRASFRLSQVDLAERLIESGFETNPSAVHSLENPNGRSVSKPRWDLVNAIASLKIAKDQDGLPYTTEELMLIACGWEPPRVGVRAFELSGEEHQQLKIEIKKALQEGGPERLTRWLMEGGNEGPGQTLIIMILDLELIARDLGLRSALELLARIRSARSPNEQESSQSVRH